MSFESGRTAYDLSLNIMDERIMDHIVLSVRADLYTQQAAEFLMTGYESIVKSFAQDPNISLAKPDIYPKAAVEEAMKFGQGMSCLIHSPYHQEV